MGGPVVRVQQIPSRDEKKALVGTAGTPSATNRYVTNEDPRLLASHGDTGIQGDTGVQGIKGDTGLQGIAGDTGFKGDTGTQGDTGIKGDTGADSTVPGDTGFKGDTGIGVQGDTGVQGVVGDTGIDGPAIPRSVITSNTNAVDNHLYICDSSGGAFNLVLPVSPTTGMWVEVVDAKGTFATNHVTVVRSGERIDGDAEDLVLDLNNASIVFTYSGSATRGWHIQVSGLAFFV